MVIKCTLSFSLESIKYYAGQFSDLPPLPEYITKKGPYVNNKEGAAHQMIILYKFDRSKSGEAWTNILKQIDFLRGVPGFALSAHIVEKGWEDKAYRINQQSRGIFMKSRT
ncbi:MAG: hypothetical protein OEW45_03545 [Deltaproteobacteria bacterium]|nr:hypothetical protein [Deltaproteobacteria bacterium]